MLNAVELLCLWICYSIHRNWPLYFELEHGINISKYLNPMAKEQLPVSCSKAVNMCSSQRMQLLEVFLMLEFRYHPTTCNSIHMRFALCLQIKIFSSTKLNPFVSVFSL